MDRRRIEEGLYAFNVEATGIGDGKMLSLLLRDSRGRLQGGLLGHTWGGCLTVVVLWVDVRYRGQGYGMRLMEAAEAEARKRRCKASLLSTHTFQARPFYELLGYRVVAEVRNYPKGHGQYFMRKRLAPHPRKRKV